MAADLSQAKCILLAVHFASSANIPALHSFTPSHPDKLTPELVLRILLTYLPESVEPRSYTTYVSEVASRLYLDVDREHVDVDTSAVAKLSEEQAKKQVKKLHLLELQGSRFPLYGPDDTLTRFLCHRAHRIDQETGLLHLVPQLVEPFLERNDYLRTWYTSVALPLLRLQVEYYNDSESVPSKSMSELESMSSKEAVDFLLSKAAEQDGAVQWDQPTAGKRSTVARDVKGIVGPWMYGHTDRKRRRTGAGPESHQQKGGVDKVASRIRKVSLTGLGEEDVSGHDWEYVYRWLVTRSQDEFAVVTHCIEDWNGPSEVDLGEVDKAAPTTYLDEDLDRKLALQYAQTAFASCYAARADSEATVKGAHSILARLAEMLDFIPPPDLATSVESLPHIERHATKLDESQTVADLEPDSLLEPRHPLTTPRMETYMLLQMMVYSAYQLTGLGHPMSLINVAKLHFYASASEQLETLRRILRTLTRSEPRKDETQWTSDRAKLMWLWSWGIDSSENEDKSGAGVLGKISKEIFEEEMFKSFVDTGMDDVDPDKNLDALGGVNEEDLSFPFASATNDETSYEMTAKLYLRSSQQTLSEIRVEELVVAKAMEAYDSASNGNKTRGGMKKANDIILAFKSHFPNSDRFRSAKALIAATHSLSFYSLALQHGVPFQPVSIRASKDPIDLIEKALEQNPRSYTKLDDLIDIGRNLVSATTQDETDGPGVTEQNIERQRKTVERRVTFMAVQAALREEDFETAYSYIVNRLTPSGADIDIPEAVDKEKQHRRNISTSSMRQKKEAEDDISWRAAFLAGRYRPAAIAPPTLRRLEQRTELLALALLLAPQSMLTEILAAWRRCEEETMALQLSQQQAEEDFDDRADQRSSRALPGNFMVGGEQPELIMNQKRREMGRMGGSRRGEDEAPLSMFDLTRSAAQVFSRNAFASASGERQSTDEGMEGSRESLGDGEGGSEAQRVRRRDMVANAASGALASGLGWVLGARPGAGQQQPGRE